MRRQTLIATAQPNFIVRTAQDNAAEPKGDPDQYAIGKLHLPEVHRLATGKGVLIAVIDSEIDAAHPDLAGAIAANFDSTGTADEPDPHGTGMAGAIASHSKLLGVAPRASLLAVRAFAKKSGGAEGTTFRIVKGLDWAAAQNARIVNMSFAGPSDPAVQAALEGAHDRGLVLVAAAGNAGPKSPPLYPASDPNVIAVTATDVDDELFTNANRGKHIAVAAPGVDVLVPAPGDSYQITSGTSVAAAEVSGVAALMLERNPALKPDEVRRILMATARHLGAKGRNPEFGAGLVDPREAVEMAPRGVAQTQ
jgi:subtilisin family serine protease